MRGVFSLASLFIAFEVTDSDQDTDNWPEACSCGLGYYTIFHEVEIQFPAVTLMLMFVDVTPSCLH